MKGFKSAIRNTILLKVGTTDADYNEISTPNIFGYDAVDKLILPMAVELDNRLVKIFGFLYKCHEADEIVDILVEENNKKIALTTIGRYANTARGEIINKIINDRATLDQIKDAVESEYDKKKD